jgi:Zn-dependent protease with chaperone function
MGFVERLLSLLFCSKTNELKDPCKYGIEIHPDIIALIEKFNPNIKIKIKDTPKIFAQAPLLNSTCIILSKRLFEEFIIEDIKVIVAHELGHIIPKSPFKILFCFITLTGIATFLILWFTRHFLYSLLIVVFLLLCISYLSCEDEKRADSFVIVKAEIPVESFAQCFSRIRSAQQNESLLETRWEFLKNSIEKLLFNFHPSIEQRISRVRTLYGTKK